MLEQDKLDFIKTLCINKFLVPFEGTGPVDSEGNFLAYLDPVGIPTIAWGFTFDENNNKIKLGDKWSKDRAIKHKSKVLDKFLNDLLMFSPVLNTESPIRVAAILSWVYNLGIGKYAQSTFKKRIDERDWEGAFKECRRWNKAGGKVLNGLTKRRDTEAISILTGWPW